MKVIIVINSKGGSGKTTFVANLGLELVDNYKKVLLLDLDLQRSLQQWWSVRTENNPSLEICAIKDVPFLIKTAKEKEYDFLLIDTPGEFSDRMTNILSFVDLAIVPCKPTPTDFKAVGYTLNMLTSAKKKFFFIFTQGVKHSSLSFYASAQLSKFGRIAPVQMMHRVSYAKAMATGEGGKFSDKLAKREVREIYEFVNEVLEEENEKK